MTNIDQTPAKSAKGQAILKQALKMFAKEGYRNADVEVIAELAGVGKGTVYRHYGNKEQLFLATAEHCMQEAGMAFARRVSIGKDGEVSFPNQSGRKRAAGTRDPLDAVEVIREIGRAYAEYYHDHPEAIEIMIHERAEFGVSIQPSHLAYRKAQRSRMDNFLSKAMGRGALRETDERTVTNAFADILFGSVVNGYMENGKKGLKARVENAVELLLVGLVPVEQAN